MKKIFQFAAVFSNVVHWDILFSENPNKYDYEFLI